MLTIQQTLDSTKILEELLQQLQDGEIKLIEYRTDDWPGAAGCHLRIRWQPTAGGMQFGIRTINSLGQEGSGHYTPDAREMSITAMKFVEHFHRPTPLQAKLNALRKDKGGTRPVWAWKAI